MFKKFLGSGSLHCTGERESAKNKYRLLLVMTNEFKALAEALMAAQRGRPVPVSSTLKLHI